MAVTAAPLAPMIFRSCRFVTGLISAGGGFGVRNWLNCTIDLIFCRAGAPMTLWPAMLLRVAAWGRIRLSGTRSGYRRWQIGGCDASTPLLPGTELQIIDNFQPTEEWLLGPGDLLYLPLG